MSKRTQKPAETQGIMRPFTFEHLPIRGRLLRISNITAHINALERGDDAIAHALAEMLSAAAVLAHDMRDNANITLQITSKGRVPLLLAKCNYKGVLRAFAKKEEGDTPPDALSAQSIFTITVDYGRGQETYQSIVPIDATSVAQTMETYLQQSSNLPTLFKVFVAAGGKGQTSCGALFLQALAEKAPPKDDDWQRMALLLSTLKAHEVLPGEVKEIDLISRLFAEDDVRVFPRQPLTFAENSNRERMLEALKSLGVEECHTLLQEEKGTLKMTDEYTGQSEIFTDTDMAKIFGDTWQK